MQAASRCRCITIVITVLHCHRVVITGAAPAMQAASRRSCVTVIVMALTTQ
jgi:hypothetical protein